MISSFSMMLLIVLVIFDRVLDVVEWFVVLVD